MKTWWVAASITGFVGAAFAAASCGNSSDTSSSGAAANGCVKQSSEGTAGTSPIYGACGGSCSCDDNTSAGTAACATPCVPIPQPDDGVTGPRGTCLSFDKATYYCSRICTAVADCPDGGTCDYGPVHETAGIVVDTKKYCIKGP